MSGFQILPADLIFVKGKDWISIPIERITHSPYSHVAGLVKPNELIAAQAFRKTGYQGLDYYDGESDVFTCDSVTDEQRAQIVAYVMGEVGQHYGYLLIPWELDHFLLHIDAPLPQHVPPDCSELWLNAYRSAGIDLCPGLKVAAPGDLAQSKLLRKVGSF